MFFKSSTDLVDISSHLIHLYFNLLFFNPINSYSDLIFFHSIHFLHSLLLFSDELSARSDNLLCISLQLSINFNLYVIVLPSLFSFLIGTEKVIYFSVFSPKLSNWPLNSSANSLIIK